MSKKLTIEALDRTLQAIMGNNLPFGGKIVIFRRDFKRVMPVVRKATRIHSIDACLVKSYLRPIIEKLHLKEPKNDADFCNYLLRIGDGIAPLTFQI